MPDDSRQTVIESGTEFEGAIDSQCAVSVSGKLKGTVQAPTLTVAPSGAVHGQIKVSTLKSEGEVSGEITADQVELSGRISDHTMINTRTLEVSLNQPEGGLQVTFGNCELRVGDRPMERRTDTQQATARATREEPTL